MKRLAGLLMTVLFSSVLLYAQQSSQATQSQTGKGTEMTGWICNSKCVTHTAGTAACDQNCTEKTGDVVFVDDSGKVTKISNPNMAMDKMGKKVKVHCDMNKEQGTMELYDVILSNPPG